MPTRYWIVAVVSMVLAAAATVPLDRESVAALAADEVVRPQGPTATCAGDAFASGLSGAGYNVFSGKLLAGSPNRLLTVLDPPLEPGRYRLIGGSYDGHDGRSTETGQTEEVWIADFKSASGNVLATSAASQDLPDGPGFDEANWEGSMGQITIEEPATRIEIRHGLPRSGGNSLHVVCLGGSLDSEPALETILKRSGFDVTETDTPTFAPGAYQAQILAEFAGAHATNALGVYNVGETACRPIIRGEEGGRGLVPSSIHELRQDSEFGLCLIRFDGVVVYTDPAKNAGENQLARIFTDDKDARTFFVGFEDSSDDDFQDMVVRITRSPVWVDRGPHPIILPRKPTCGPSEVSAHGCPSPVTSTVDLSQGNAITGAVEAIAPHPTNTNVIFIASASGGVWQTRNANESDPANIIWTPLTDQLPSLSTSAIALSPRDPDTVYVGTGSFSAGCTAANDCPDGGPGIGVLKSTDSGLTWTVVGQDVFGGQRVRSVVPTGNLSAHGEVILAATIGEGADAVANPSRGGLYRSEDSGDTWTKLTEANGLPQADVSHLIQDPQDPDRLYLAVPGLTADGDGQEIVNTASPGVYRSDDGGEHWVIDNGPSRRGPGRKAGDPGDDRPDINISELVRAKRIELAICCSDNTAESAIYAALIRDGGPVHIYRSTDVGTADLGATWSEIDGTWRLAVNTFHFSILADHSDVNLLYLGDRTSGPWRVRFTQSPPGAQWTSLRGEDEVGKTEPHVDSRDMRFSTDSVAANRSIIEANDGGIVRLVNPEGTTANPGIWNSLNGNLGTVEVFSVAHDNMNNTNPDDDVFLVGTQDNGSADGNLGIGWTGRKWGDGWWVQANEAAGFHYFTNSRNWERFDSVGTSTILTFPVGTDVSGKRIFQLNVIDSARLLTGESGQLLESTDNGDTFTVINETVGTPRGFAYGGMAADGTANAEVAYVATDIDIYVREQVGDPFKSTGFQAFHESLGNRLPTLSRRDIVLDPTDYRTAYVVDGNDVFGTTDLGQSWALLTGNVRELILSPFAGLPGPAEEILAPHLLTSVALARDDTADKHQLFVAGVGGVYTLDLSSSAGPAAVNEWSEYGLGLPNAKVRDMEYDEVSDLLTVGTWGRGVWTITPG